MTVVSRAIDPWGAHTRPRPLLETFLVKLFNHFENLSNCRRYSAAAVVSVRGRGYAPHGSIALDTTVILV